MWLNFSQMVNVLNLLIFNIKFLEFYCFLHNKLVLTTQQLYLES